MVTLMCGKIAAGKTTEAEKIAKNGAVLLSCDELMLTVFTECLGSKHAETERRCLRYLFKTAKQLGEKGVDSVIDAGFWTRDERAEAEAFFKTAGISMKEYKSKSSEYVRQTESIRSEWLEEGKITDEAIMLLWLLRECCCLNEIFSKNELEKVYTDLNNMQTESIINEWRRFSVTLGNEVCIISKDSKFNAIADDITQDGRLIVRCSDGSSTEIMSGEISVRGIMGYTGGVK
jgi:hypothetical protein